METKFHLYQSVQSSDLSIRPIVFEVKYCDISAVRTTPVQYKMSLHYYRYAQLSPINSRATLILLPIFTFFLAVSTFSHNIYFVNYTNKIKL